MRLIAWLTVVASLVLAPLAGCATCPNGRCASQKVVDECCDDACSQCGSDGILPNGFPCECCGPRLCNPFTGQPVRTYFSNIMTCGGGCSEVYWGEWRSDPPDPCDPCVNLGTCSRRGFLTNFWDTIANGNCSDDCCADNGCHDDCTHTGHEYAPHATPRLKAAPPHAPLDPAPAPPSVSPEDIQPDQKAVRPRRVIRR